MTECLVSEEEPAESGGVGKEISSAVLKFNKI